MTRALTLIAAALIAVLLTAGSASAADPQPTALPAAPGSEKEPNGPNAEASPIASGERIRASLYPNGDIDRYHFTAEAGDRVYATVMTSGSAGSSADSQLRLLSADGTTIEFDDDNGSLASLSSSIAGATIPSAGTYYLDVRDFTAGTTTILPYDLWLHVRSGAPVTEAEPNDEASSANALSGGYVAGARDPAGDEDLYALELDAGDTVFLSLDLDPERDGTTFNGRLGFGDAQSIVVVNDPGTADDIDSEAYVATVPTSGTYYAYVDSTVAGAGGPTATYHLSATVIPSARPSCRTYTITPPTGTIPDPGVATFPIDVADAGTVDHVAIKLDATHDRMSDLDVTLQAPGGSQTALFTDIGATAAGTSNTRMLALFDDNAGTPPLAALLRSVALQPEKDARLDYFHGQQAAGTWNLTFRDDQGSQAGTLARADLILCARPAEGPVDTVFSAGFESGADGFTHSGTNDEWEHGVPATQATATANPVAGVTSCGEGQQCFKTDLDGTYDANSSQDLVSPPISLEGRTGAIYASWAMWYQIEAARFDHASVTIEEDGGGNSRPLFTWLGATMVSVVGNPSVNLPLAAGWGVHRADVSDYAGKTIRLRFHLDSDSTVAFAGLAIDDVRVYQPSFDLDLDIAGSGNGYVDSTPAGIDCGSDTAAHPACSVTRSGQVTLTAHPDADSSFAGFSGGGCSGSATTCTVALDQARNVTATFDLLPHAPVADPDAYETPEDTPLDVDAPGVLDGDTDRDGDALTAALESGPQHGTLDLEADGSFTYTPDADYSGGDSFSYRASDGGLESDPATVTIDVSAVDDLPPAAPPAAAPPASAAPPAAAPPTAPAVAEPAISDLRLGSRCVRRSASGRVRVPMTMRLAQPGAIVVSIDRALGSRTRRSCPRQNRTRDYDTRFRPVTTVRPRTQAAAAAVARRVMLDLRLKPGLYRIGVRVRVENGRLSRPVHAFLRVVG